MYTAAKQLEILRNRGTFHARKRPWLERIGLSVDKGNDDGGGAGGDNGSDDDSGDDDAGDGDDGGNSLEALKKQLNDATTQIESLKAKNDDVISEKRKLQLRVEEREKEAEEAARKAGDVSALEKSWKKKHETETGALKSQLDERDKMIHDLTAGAEAQRIASDIAVQGSAKVLTKHIRDRLKAEIRDGKPVTVVLDEEGKPSAMTVEELKKSFLDDPAFAPLVVGSKARGSGGPGDKPAGGGKSIKRADYDALSTKEKAAFWDSNPNARIVD